jgi:hypothetical protein
MKILRGNIEQLIAWAVTFFAYLKTHLTTWGVSTAWVTEVETKFSDMQEAYNYWSNPATKTKAAHTDMEEKRKVFVKAVEPLIQNLRTLPTLTPPDYALLQITPSGSGPGPKKPVPSSWPLLTLGVHGQGVVDIHYRDVNTPLSKAKPDGAHEIVIRLGFNNEASASVDDLTETPITATRTPHRVTFPLERLGQRLHASGAWVNPTGERGPWGPIASVVVS